MPPQNLFEGVQTVDPLFEGVPTEEGKKIPDTTTTITTTPQNNEPGNIDLYKQPKVKNPDGTTSTVDSHSYNIDGMETLLPSVTPDGRHLKTDDEIIDEYKKTGRHLGRFSSVEEANKYAEQLHNDYAAGKYDVDPNAPPVEDNRSVFKRGWDAISSPLVELGGAGNTPQSQAAHELMMKEHPWLTTGMDATTGLVSGLTSPLSVGTMGVLGAEGAAASFGLPRVAAGLNTFSKGLAPFAAAAGVEDIDQGHPVLGGLEVAGALWPFRKGITGNPHATVNEPLPATNPLDDIEPEAKHSLFDRFRTNRTIQGRLDKIGQEAKDLMDVPREQIKIKAPEGVPTFKIDPVTGKFAKTKLEVPDMTAPDAKLAKLRIKLDQATKRFNTIQEVIDNINSRTDITDKKKARLIKQVNANQISATGELPNNPSWVGSTNNFSKAMLTSYDVSAPGRQGLPLWYTKAFWTSWDDMFKSWRSKQAYDDVMKGISSREMFQTQFDAKGKVIPSFAQKSGLALSDLLNNREERFASSIAERFPGVKASERAYGAFLNKLRADHFETLINAAEKAGLNPKGNQKLAQDIAKFINTSTGRGDLGRFEQDARLLHEVFFAPRFMASRFNMLDPRYYASLDPFARRRALGSALALATASASMNMLYSFAFGGETGLDPTSTDFAKTKIGNTRMDPNAGIQQPIVLISRLAADIARRGPGILDTAFSGDFGTDPNSPKQYKFKEQTGLDVASNFLANKLNPVQSFFWAMLRGTDFDQKPFELKRALIQRAAPIMSQDIKSLIDEGDPTLLGLIPFAAVGQGMNTYSR